MSQAHQVALDYPRDKKYALIVQFDIAKLFNKIDTTQGTIDEMQKKELIVIQ